MANESFIDNDLNGHSPERSVGHLVAQVLGRGKYLPGFVAVA